MRHCSYIYDAEGMRWEDGNMLVDLLVDGTAATFAVVRSGQGRSRIERFTDTPHRLDSPTRKISGEITATDLQRIVENGSFTSIALLGVFAEIDISAGATRRDAATIAVTAVSEHGEFLTSVAPKRCVGAGGRQTNVETLRGAFERLDHANQKALALSQLDTMPKSGRAGGPAAVLRLAVVLEYVTTREFLERSELHPSVLLHLTPQSWALLTGRTDPSDRAALDALRTRATRERDIEHSVVLTLDAIAGGDSSGPLLTGEAQTRLVRELGANQGVSRSLELLIEHGAPSEVIDLLAQAAKTDAASVYTSDLMLMLTRIGNETATSVSAHVGTNHAETLAADDRTMRVLGDQLRHSVITNAPLSALERGVLDETEIAYACTVLVDLLSTTAFIDDELIARRIDALAPRIRTRVLGHLVTNDSTRNNTVVVAGARRLETARRARLRGTLRELQRLAQALAKDVSMLGSALTKAGESCVEQGRIASLSMLTVRHSGLADADTHARLERGRLNLYNDIRERRQVISRRLADLDAGVLLLEDHVDDATSLVAVRETLTSLRTWYGRQSTDIDSIRYPVATTDMAKTKVISRDLIELGERLPTEVNARVEDVSRVLDELVPTP
jgi:hypothetical protein